MTRDEKVNSPERSRRVKEIIKRLKKVYPHTRTALTYKNPFQLLVATILSAQTTDKLVNQVTPALFEKYPTAKDFADTPLSELDGYIKKVNFHNNKAKNIQAAAKIIDEKYQGKVPDNMEELDALPGVARKTANVVLGNAFNIAAGIVVDTHVMRLSQRFGLTKQKDPVKIEKDLMEIVPKKDWIDFPNMLTYFGREYCPARPHVCANCPLEDMCPDKKK